MTVSLLLSLIVVQLLAALMAKGRFSRKRKIGLSVLWSNIVGIPRAGSPGVFRTRSGP